MIANSITALLVVAGVGFITIPRIHHNLRASQEIIAEPITADTSFTATPVTAPKPVQILIPSVNIDLPVTSSALRNGYWVTSETTASFGEGSSPPGEGSNTVIFAHAREGLFLPLREVKQGQSVYVFTTNRYFRYEIISIAEVAPTETYTIKPTEDERLTLFTCSGFLDSKRLVVTAKPI